jgi:hypothetical protein
MGSHQSNARAGDFATSLYNPERAIRACKRLREVTKVISSIMPGNRMYFHVPPFQAAPRLHGTAFLA